ncbi:MAG: YihA family ribosome biogenesis GTP-binding protein [Gammaproteobacteria bacterium]|nr:YihA family ribosome biogenesis GTP-binding protein [Gammaproteobacteria bacterium]
MSGQADNQKLSPGRNPLQAAHFLLSTPSLLHAPQDSGREVAFAGRSNAGKSSALNVLCNQKALARTSKTPGRTQQLVFFGVTEQVRLVDLPGYGYAKVNAQTQQQWQSLMESFLGQRQALHGIVLVMDIRHPLTEYDQQMLEWCHYHRMPVLVLLTKADKLSRGAAHNTLHSVRRELEALPLCQVQLFSATKRTGVEEAREQICNWLALS